MTEAQNRFEIVEVLPRRVGDLRASMAEDFSTITEGLDDDDFVVRVIGRCVEGPDRGRKASNFQVATAELMSDAAVWRSFIEDAALTAWEHLPQGGGA